MNTMIKVSTTAYKYQVFRDHGNFVLDGLWEKGGTPAQFESLSEATAAAEHLLTVHPDRSWVVCEIGDAHELTPLARFGTCLGTVPEPSEEDLL